jgi:concanavalin A-like lectin/glucanase superfamily protein
MPPVLLNPSLLGAAGGGGSGYSAAVLADTPLVYWRLGEASGTTMNDASGNSRHGTYQGSPTLAQASLISTDADTSVAFASGSRGEFAVPGSWANTAQFSAEAWVYLTTFSGNHKTIVQHDDVGSNIAWRMSFLNDGRMLCYAHIAGSLRTAVSTTTFSLNTKYHVVATYDGTTLLLFVNKVQRATVSISGSIRSVTAPIEIGCLSNGTGEPFTGRIDEVAIYDHALTTTRIDAHYDAA